MLLGFALFLDLYVVVHLGILLMKEIYADMIVKYLWIFVLALFVMMRYSFYFIFASMAYIKPKILLNRDR